MCAIGEGVRHHVSHPCTLDRPFFQYFCSRVTYYSCARKLNTTSMVTNCGERVASGGVLSYGRVLSSAISTVIPPPRTSSRHGAARPRSPRSPPPPLGRGPVADARRRGPATAVLAAAAARPSPEPATDPGSSPAGPAPVAAAAAPAAVVAAASAAAAVVDLAVVFGPVPPVAPVRPPRRRSRVVFFEDILFET